MSETTGQKPIDPILEAMKEAFELGEEYSCECCTPPSDKWIEDRLNRIKDRWFF